MASTREIRTRINSVKSTAKITKAMQLVSAAKMQKAQDNYSKSKLYAETLFEIVNKMGNISDFQHPLIRKSEVGSLKSDNIGILVVGTDRGFVGSMVTNLTIEAYKLKQDLLQKYPEAQIHGISLFKTGLKIVQNAGINDLAHFSEYLDKPSQNFFGGVYSFIEDKFAKGELDQVYIVNTEFVNTLVQKAVSKKILPIEQPEVGSRKLGVKQTQNLEPQTSNFNFEPSQDEILNWLLPEYFKSTIYTSILSSIASEYSSRMVSMKNATDSANDLVDDLTLKFNKTRQAAITQQIIEVVSGAV
jgi:F-type H+-transporting ATPase subunit gamma